MLKTDLKSISTPKKKKIDSNSKTTGHEKRR